MGDVCDKKWAYNRTQPFQINRLGLNTWFLWVYVLQVFG